MPGSGTAVPPDEPPEVPPEVEVVVPPEVEVVVPPEVVPPEVVVPPDVVVVPPEVLLLVEVVLPHCFWPDEWPQPHECLWPPACAGAARPIVAAVVSERASSVLRNIGSLPRLAKLVYGNYANGVPIPKNRGFSWLTPKPTISYVN